MKFAPVMLFLVAHAAFSQASSGLLEGTIFDGQQAAVPDASVVIANELTGVRRTTRSNSVGAFVVPFLEPGRYSVEVEATGFRRALRKGIALQVAQKLSLDFQLDLGSVTEQITVAAEAPLINSVDSTLGQVVENRRIQELPLNGRDPFSLANLAPGVVPAAAGAAHLGGAVPGIGGASNFTSELTIDGVPDTAPKGTASNSALIYTPSPDAIEEFKIQTNALNAEFGRFNGGVVSVVTKSGTNTLHGSLYEFLRNSAFDANDFFNNRAGIPLEALRRNQFGGSVGGPVLLPRLYSGRNRTFFFFDYEGFREAAPNPTNFTVPTPLERRGDFSKTVNAQGALIRVFDPYSLHSSGSAMVRDQFPGNVVPASLQNAIAQKLIQFYPEPNNSRLTSNLVIAGVRRNRNDSLDARLDHNFGPAHRVFGRLSLQNPKTGEFNFFGNMGNPTNPPLVQHRRAFTLQDVYTISPTLIVNLNYGISRVLGQRVLWSFGTDITQFGFPAYLRAAQQVPAIPAVTVAGYAGIGSRTQNRGSQYGHTLQASVTKVAATHTIKAGGEYRAYFDNGYPNGTGMGAFSFTAGMTQGPNPNQASSSAGNGLATMLLGIPGGSIRIDPSLSTKNTYMAGYVQDDWKITQRLTLNLGLRYDVNMPRSERQNRISIFEVNAVSPIARQAPSFPNLRGAMKFRNPEDRSFSSTDWNNVAPRAGFAYRLSAATSLRGGYGIFYGLSPTDAALVQAGYTDGFSATTSVITSLDGVTPISRLADPFPGGINRPLQSTQLGPDALLGQSVSSALLSMRNPYMQQWNLSLQRQLPGRIVAEAAYARNKGTHLPMSGVQLNALTPEQTLLGTANQQLVPNPFYGIITDTTTVLSNRTITRGQLLKPYPQYTGVSAPLASIGNSDYHALMARVEKRMTRGFSVLVSYTNAKRIDDCSQDGTGPVAGGAQDPYNLRAERSLDSQDVSQRLVVSGIWEVPVGRRKALGGNMPRMIDAILGGWQVNGIASFQKGFPLAITSIGGSRPNRIATGKRMEGRIQDRLNRYFDTSAFAVPAAFTNGNSSRTAPDLRGPGINNFDLSAFKYFPIKERMQGQFRVESFNAFNRVQFGNPGVQTGSQAFGVISSQQNMPRQLQFALRITF